MINLNRITRPSLLLDEDKCRKNIRMMVNKAKSSKVKFRPHFKTHQSIAIGEWFREEGVNAITVSSVTMAKHFSDNGWQDITIAFPANIREMDMMKELSHKTQLNLLVSGLDQVSGIKNNISFEAGCFLKINTGMNRSGTEWNDHQLLLRIIEELEKSKTLRILGFLTHAGHTYKAKSVNEIINIYNDTCDKLTSLRQLVPSGEIVLSVGDTPSCSLVENFNGVDEIRPGNFVFYDLTQYYLGSCKTDQIAIAVACPVVDKNNKRNEIIIYGGGVHLSKDRMQLSDGRTIFGLALRLTEEGWVFQGEDSYLKSISQEHGIISCAKEFYHSVRIGDLIGIIPVHSCMTADLLREYHTLTGKIISDFSPK